MTQLDLVNVWKLVKTTRKSFLSNKKRGRKINLDCDTSYTLIHIYYIKSNIDSLAEKLLLNPTSVPNENVSHKSLKTAGEMFTYLNYCPNIDLEDIITDVLENGTPKDIILAFISILKASKSSIKQSIRNLLLKVMESCKLDTYEKIQILTKGKCYTNGTFSTCTSKMNFTDEDIRQLGKFSFELQ